jgi:GAF domain-containing protein
VFDAIAERAARICQATDARVYVLDGDRLIHASGHGDLKTDTGRAIPLQGSITGQAVMRRVPLQIEDSAAASEAEFPFARRMAEEKGHRTVLAVPLLRENRQLGAIVMRRTDVLPFSDKQIALLRTFADQAAIAIENVRLFNDTKEALERQTATADILSVIADR